MRGSAAAVAASIVEDPAFLGAVVAAVIAVTVPIVYARWQARRSVIRQNEREESARRELAEREEATKRKYADRQESAKAWTDLAGQLTSAFGTMRNRDDDVAAARGTLNLLQGASQSQLQPAFGLDSMVVCAERHIRQLMQAALQLAEDAVKAGDTDEGKSTLKKLRQFNSAEIDTARRSVFEAEVAAWREQPDRDVVQPASPVDDRVKLREAVQRHCKQQIPCDLLPDRQP